LADRLDPPGMPRSYRCLRRGPPAPHPCGLRRLLQRTSNASDLERTCPWASMRRLIDRSNGSVSSSRGQSSGGFITNIAGYSSRQGQGPALRRNVKIDSNYPHRSVQFPWAREPCLDHVVARLSGLDPNVTSRPRANRVGRANGACRAIGDPLHACRQLESPGVACRRPCRDRQDNRFAALTRNIHFLRLNRLGHVCASERRFDS